MELEPLWRWFCRLSSRRQSGMAANPLTYQDIEAFERKALVRLSAWQTDLIVRLDDAVLAVWNERSRTTPNGPQTTEIPVTDTAALKTMFRGIAERRRLEAQARAQAKEIRAKRRGDNRQ